MGEWKIYLTVPKGTGLVSPHRLKVEGLLPFQMYHSKGRAFKILNMMLVKDHSLVKNKFELKIQSSETIRTFDIGQ